VSAAVQAAICARAVRPSLAMTCWTGVSAVLAEITSLAAMSRLDRPWVQASISMSAACWSAKCALRSLSC
jgi:hypothetical protein